VPAVPSTSPPTLRRRLGAVLIASVLALLIPSGIASADTYSEERDLFNATNADRAANGRAALSYDAAASSVARAWSQEMAASRSLRHNPNLAAQVGSRVTSAWTRIGENVGVGYDIPSLERAFMNSPGHRANILGAYNRVGVGTARSSDNRLWVTVVFVQGPAISSSFPAPPAPPAPSGSAWYVRNALSTGVADLALSYGMATDRPLTCDWNGDGIDSPGVFRNGLFYLRNTLTSGTADLVVGFGMTGDVAVCGDWNGDGIDSPGVFRNGVFYLRNSLTSGTAEMVAGYGMPGDRPVVGDWNGDGIDTIGVYRNGIVFLTDWNIGGFATIVFGYGQAGDAPLAGDWNGDGIDTIGISRNGAFYLRQSNTTGVADRAFSYGNPTDAPRAGDWNGDGLTSVAVVRAV
jgi:uncharacterized protein YkwD